MQEVLERRNLVKVRRNSKSEAFYGSPGVERRRESCDLLVEEEEEAGVEGFSQVFRLERGSASSSGVRVFKTTPCVTREADLPLGDWFLHDAASR